MKRARIRAVLFASVAAAALLGCEKAVDDAGSVEDAPVARAATSVRLVDRDVEAPQVFQVSDQALWDGRPSLGGVWVASPDAVDPERVILRNPANGKFVIGALFRRERLNPGPTLQISSDAAAALGILAGQPSKIDVTALRREEAEETPAPDATKPILDANESVETTALAAIDRAEGETDPSQTAIAAVPAATGIAPDAGSDVVADSGADAGAGSVATTDLAAAEPVVEPKPRRKRAGLFGKRKATGSEAQVETAALEASAGIETTALTAAAAGPAPVAAVAAAPIAAAAKPAGRAALIQIGIFSVDANADRAVKMLTAKGVAARKLTETSQGKTFWRVVADAPDGNATLASVKAAGFADAYPVSR
ncbi:MAG: SPOR domain-containing protein [Gemmobacter sp.]